MANLRKGNVKTPLLGSVRLYDLRRVMEFMFGVDGLEFLLVWELTKVGKLCGIIRAELLFYGLLYLKGLIPNCHKGRVMVDVDYCVIAINAAINFLVRCTKNKASEGDISGMNA